MIWGWQLDRNVPEATPQNLCLVTSSFLIQCLGFIGCNSDVQGWMCTKLLYLHIYMYLLIFKLFSIEVITECWVDLPWYT